VSVKNKKTGYRVLRPGTLLVIPIVCFTFAILAFSASMEEDLVQAAGNNDINSLNALIGKGVNVKAANAFLATPLIWSADFGNVDVVNALIDYGADLEASDFYGWTPLMKAIWQSSVSGPLPVVEALGFMGIKFY